VQDVALEADPEAPDDVPREDGDGLRPAVRAALEEAHDLPQHAHLLVLADGAEDRVVDAVRAVGREVLEAPRDLGLVAVAPRGIHRLIGEAGREEVLVLRFVEERGVGVEPELGAGELTAKLLQPDALRGVEVEGDVRELGPGVVEDEPEGRGGVRVAPRVAPAEAPTLEHECARSARR
jgi:hypothetical protein